MGKFELMALPYAIDALEPVISRQTLEFHHGKHLADHQLAPHRKTIRVKSVIRPPTGAFFILYTFVYPGASPRAVL